MKKFAIHTTLVIVNVCFLLSTSFAQFVNSEQAKNVAVSLYNQRKPAKSRLITTSNITTESLQYFKDVPVYYVFNIDGGEAFAIIAADQRIHPAIGYSFQSAFDEENIADCLDWLLFNYRQQIYDVVLNNLVVNEPEIAEEWQQLGLNNTTKSGSGQFSIQSVSPLTTTTWSQGCYYNAMCPADNSLGTTRCGRVPTGCVATAFGQVLKYYNHPAQGNGSNTYSNSSYGTITANFGSTVYDWANMPNKLLASNNDVAQLLFHTGVAVNMTYSANSSSAYTTAVRSALVNKFKYATSAQNVTKSSYTNTQWENLIRTELDAQRVVIINGNDPAANAGHAFIADGYQGTNSFHINWGWNGSCDGYFLLTALSPSSYSFNTNVGAIIGIKPLVPTTSCAAVNGLSVNSVTSSSAILTWSSVNGASNNYNIKYKPVSSSTWVTVSSTTNSKSISGLTAGTNYHFQVQRVCSNTSSSSYSSAKTFTTLMVSSPNTSLVIGTGTSSSGAAPYGTSNMDERSQFIITKSQLVAAGYTSANTYIKSLAFEVASANSKTMNSFTIKIGHTSSSTYTSTSFINSPTTTVYSGNYSATSGWNTHTFSTPFQYDGTSNLLIDICWNNTSSASNSTVKCTSTSTYQALYKKTNVANGDACSNSTGTRTYSRPNMKLVFSSTALRPDDEVDEPQVATGIENEVIGESFSMLLYPNPANEFVTVSLDGVLKQAQLNVYDMIGKNVFSVEIKDNNYALSLENFLSGVYIVVLQNDNKYFKQRLVVKRN